MAHFVTQRGSVREGGWERGRERQRCYRLKDRVTHRQKYSNFVTLPILLPDLSVRQLKKRSKRCVKMLHKSIHPLCLFSYRVWSELRIATYKAHAVTNACHKPISCTDLIKTRPFSLKREMCAGGEGWEVRGSVLFLYWVFRCPTGNFPMGSECRFPAGYRPAITTLVDWE